jgi:hypothetical protein
MVGWPLLAALMGTVPVVLRGVGGEHREQVQVVEDKQAI